MSFRSNVRAVGDPSAPWRGLAEPQRIAAMLADAVAQRPSRTAGMTFRGDAGPAQIFTTYPNIGTVDTSTAHGLRQLAVRRLPGRAVGGLLP